MKQFICQVNKELIDLGAVEMDEILKKLIPENMNEINIKVDDNDSKLFKIDRSKNVITGRGIKGFFKNVKNQKAIVSYNVKKSELILKNFDLCYKN